MRRNSTGDAAQPAAAMMPPARWRPTRRWTALACGVLLLAGCVELPGPGPVPTLYELSAQRQFTADLPKANWQLVVEEPVAAGGLDSDRIALKPSPLKLEYFADARWTSRAPRMLQTLLVESFENSGRIIGVGRQAIGLNPDFNLKSELRDFQADYASDGKPPVIHVGLSAKLVALPDNRIVAAKRFDQAVAARDQSKAAVIEAFDQATAKVLDQAVSWTLIEGGRAGAAPQG